MCFLLLKATAILQAIMQHAVKTAKTFVSTHRIECIVGVILVLIIALLVAIFIYNNPRTVVYQPVDACKLFTPTEAQNLLGDKVISINTSQPIVSGNVATSKCSYTDTNPDQNAMIVAAVAVRSGVNDKGVKQNKTDFAANKSQAGVDTINNIGESAYFDPARGQLNILSGRDWLIVSYGAGSTPESNTLESTLTLAQLALPNHSSALPQF